ncbi:hypothetical protein [Algoriphagus namhaensis]
MKKLVYLFLAGFCLSSGMAQAQSKTTKNPTEPDTIIYTKDKTIKVFGSSWAYTKTDDGKWVLDFEDEHEGKDHYKQKKNRFRTGMSNDIGINIWPQDSDAPQVKPWGSWNVALNLSGIQELGKNFEIKTTAGVSWYNFKFEDTNIVPTKTPDGLEFPEFTGDGVGTKSKISASYANLTILPTIKTTNQKLRLGVGAYAGYRIGGRGKFVYDDADGDKQKLYEKSNMYVQDFRYGLRAEIGVGDINFYINYDLNELFQENLGPQVQAISFGITTFDIN